MDTNFVVILTFKIKSWYKYFSKQDNKMFGELNPCLFKTDMTTSGCQASIYLTVTRENGGW